MSRLLTGSIDLSRIDKERLFTTEDGRKKLDIVVWLNDEPDYKGFDASIQQQTEKGEKKIYIGNLKFHKKQ